MNKIFLLLYLCPTSIFLLGCKASGDMGRREAINTIASSYIRIVEGNWYGTIAQDTIFLTFLEGEFEGAPALGGSAHITGASSSASYEIVNGTSNKKDTVWFSLYKILTNGSGDYNLKGVVDGTTLRGTFDQFDGKGKKIGNGTWKVHRFW